MSVTRFVKRSLIAFLIVHVWLHITWPVSNPKRVNPDDTAYIYVTVSAYSQVSGYKHLSFQVWLSQASSNSYIMQKIM